MEVIIVFMGSNDSMSIFLLEFARILFSGYPLAGMMHGHGQETVSQLPKAATEYSTLCCHYWHPSHLSCNSVIAVAIQLRLHRGAENGENVAKL